ncbi:hypothetical protein GYH30_025337 [Glycine max]|uniref:tRNA nucleotidyltransferase/poly(A) polymerase RNA and SrmB- binding domain-containing protein n=2 Tax=Glycine subgen. Soja TaxID=1462606 RepID=K7LEG9_SOYBN|nr:hypothetical protein JHK87_025367 [Glycine soja]KAG5013281.1 hypothetical protein JHK86_025542 [Glycine max]KAH1043455.1 hypothetical protein GYH30_025337 [Glycine max]RZB92473.1 hypothetical protein D0Y65_024451 [Glycine soja]
MEINYMLAYGSGEASLRLLWRFGLLDILLPFQRNKSKDSGGHGSEAKGPMSPVFNTFVYEEEYGNDS